MRELLSDERRRRLRMIQTVEEESEKKFHSAVSALTIASEADATRHDLEFMRHKLISECRPNSALRLRVELIGASPVEVSLDRPYLIIGSAPDCDLHLDHEEVYPRHLLLIWVDGHLFCSDISPSTSLFPGQETSPSGWWVDHHPIKVGPYYLSLTDSVSEPADFSPLDRSQRLSTEYPLLALQFEGVAQKDNVWPINRVLTLIGRNATCKLRLNHKSIAPVQACLLRTAVGCWLIDIVNNGTTFINGRIVPFSSIDTGDELQFAGFYTEVGTMSVPVTGTQESSEKPVASDRKPPIQKKPETAVTKRSVPEPMPEPAPILASVPIPASMLVTVPIPLSEMMSAPAPILVQAAAPLDIPEMAGSEIIAGNNQCCSPETELEEISVPPSKDQRKVPVVDVEPLEDWNESRADFNVLAQLVEQQQLELSRLKRRLEELKRTYDVAAGQILSKKLRDSLEKPVLEILKSYASLEKNLSHLNQAVGRAED